MSFVQQLRLQAHITHCGDGGLFVSLINNYRLVFEDVIQGATSLVVSLRHIGYIHFSH